MNPAGPSYDVITIGNVCIDLFLPPHQPPPRGGISLIPSLTVVPGGNSSNTAIAAGRLGLSVTVAGVLGDDLFGRHLRTFLTSEGVDVSLLDLLPGRHSPATVVLNDATGERSFVHYPGTDADFTLPTGVLEGEARIFHFAAPELLGSFWPEGCLAAARALKERGRTISLDTFVSPGSSAIEEHRPLLGLVDLAMPNEEEARLITGRVRVPDMAAYLLEAGVKVAVIKRGERGAVVATREEFHEVPAQAVRVVDTCGAGDNFAGGFLAGYLRGLSPEKAARIGCAMGTRCVTREGSLAATSDPAFLARLRAQLANP
jgi:sugar/nucleoside kinase (ribokinase family)